MNEQQYLNRLTCFTRILCLTLAVNPFIVLHAASVPNPVSDTTETFTEGESQDPEAVALGKKIYREGLLPSGEPLQGLVQGDIPVKGTQLACVSCHRRSGFGAVEGNVVTPVITGDVLFEPVESRASEISLLRHEQEKTRPAYNDGSLRLAIQTGKNPAGRELDKLMPRYALSDKDAGYLTAYLKTLSSWRSPGVTDAEIRFATVFTRDVPNERKRAMLRVLYRFIKDRNTETRPNTRRAQHAPWHKKWHYESHRTWTLEVWEVEGPPQTWFSQLELQNSVKPVFAILGGVADGDWTPIHEFCETKEIPCLFPNTDYPALSTDGFYTLYFSKGVALEAEALAKYLAGTRNKNLNPKITQVYTDTQTGRIPAHHFQQELIKRGITNVRDVVISDKGALPSSAESEIKNSDVVVYWLNKNEMKKWYKTVSSMQSTAASYFSASLLGIRQEFQDSAKEIAGNSFLVYPYTEPGKLDRNLEQSLKWMQKREIHVIDERLQADTLYAATLVSREVKHMGSNFSREYLVEKLEHLDQDVVLSPLYPHISLGAGQRYGSKGAYIAKIKTSEGGQKSLEIISDWIVP